MPQQRTQPKEGTLGYFIRHLRTELYTQRTQRKALTQTELAEALCYTSHRLIIDWEMNRKRPKPKDLLKIAEVTQAPPEDATYLLGLAGYLPSTRFPPKAQTLAVLKRAAACLAYLPYPAYILDYRGRFWMANQAVADMVGLDLNALRALMKPEPIDYFQVIFDSRLPFQRLLGNYDQVAHGQVARFKAININRRHELFYKDCLARAEQRLLPADYAYFAMLWQKVDAQYTPADGDYFLTEITIKRNGRPQPYSLHAEPIFQLHRLFDHIRYLPRAGELQHRLTHPQPTVCLWDMVDVSQIFPEEW
jgi:transcriptional regulator with XRE-family HTH domain